MWLQHLRRPLEANSLCEVSLSGRKCLQSHLAILYIDKTPVHPQKAVLQLCTLRFGEPTHVPDECCGCKRRFMGLGPGTVSTKKQRSPGRQLLLEMLEALMKLRHHVHLHLKHVGQRASRVAPADKISKLHERLVFEIFWESPRHQQPPILPKDHSSMLTCLSLLPAFKRFLIHPSLFASGLTTYTDFVCLLHFTRFFPCLFALFHATGATSTNRALQRLPLSGNVSCCKCTLRGRAGH